MTPSHCWLTVQPLSSSDQVEAEDCYCYNDHDDYGDYVMTTVVMMILVVIFMTASIDIDDFDNDLMMLSKIAADLFRAEEGFINCQCRAVSIERLLLVIFNLIKVSFKL